MTDQIVSFDVALMAKECGFKTKSNLFYDIQKELLDSTSIETARTFMCVAPTQSLLQKWLRENHRLYVSAVPFAGLNGTLMWEPIINKTNHTTNRSFLNFGILIGIKITYEGAIEAGLKEALKMLRDGKRSKES